MRGEFYDGIPLELPLIEEARVLDPTHLHRSLRYRGAVDIERLLTVVLLPDRHPPDGVWQVATAWPADKRPGRFIKEFGRFRDRGRRTSRSRGRGR